jgi:hypothetical protein
LHFLFHGFPQALQEFFGGGFGRLYPKSADLLFGFIDYLTCRFPALSSVRLAAWSEAGLAAFVMLDAKTVNANINPPRFSCQVQSIF